MADDIINQVTFGSDEKSLAVFHQMLEDVRADGQPLGSIDFNKLLPMPESLDMEAGYQTDRGLKLVQEYHDALDALERQKPSLSPESYTAKHRKLWNRYRKKQLADPETWALGEQAYRNIQRHGHPTWHEWRRENWGTKWNAYSCQPLHRNSDTMVFVTAWSSVPAIMKLLSQKYPEQEIAYRWADGEIGRNVGEAIYKNGEVVDADIPIPGSRGAYEMAAEIVGIGLPGHEFRDTDVPLRAPKKRGKEKRSGHSR